SLNKCNDLPIATQESALTNFFNVDSARLERKRKIDTVEISPVTHNIYHGRARCGKGHRRRRECYARVCRPFRHGRSGRRYRGSRCRLGWSTSRGIRTGGSRGPCWGACGGLGANSQAGGWSKPGDRFRTSGGGAPIYLPGVWPPKEMGGQPYGNFCVVANCWRLC